jgi:hypothetical protein
MVIMAFDDDQEDVIEFIDTAFFNFLTIIIFSTVLSLCNAHENEQLALTRKEEDSAFWEATIYWFKTHSYSRWVVFALPLTPYFAYAKSASEGLTELLNIDFKTLPKGFLSLLAAFWTQLLNMPKVTSAVILFFLFVIGRMLLGISHTTLTFKKEKLKEKAWALKQQIIEETAQKEHDEKLDQILEAVKNLQNMSQTRLPSNVLPNVEENKAKLPQTQNGLKENTAFILSGIICFMPLLLL